MALAAAVGAATGTVAYAHLLTPALLVTPGLFPNLWTLLAGACCLAWARRTGLGEHRDSRRRRD